MDHTWKAGPTWKNGTLGRKGHTWKNSGSHSEKLGMNNS